MILVDTSVWINHLRRGDKNLSEMLTEGVVLCHPFVIGELACGNIRNRAEILRLLTALPGAEEANHQETIQLLTDHNLTGKGLGWIDVNLLASALLSNSTLWTTDKSLARAAHVLGVHH